jgi:hypothetical protein
LTELAELSKPSLAELPKPSLAELPESPLTELPKLTKTALTELTQLPEPSLTELAELSKPSLAELSKPALSELAAALDGEAGQKLPVNLCPELRELLDPGTELTPVALNSLDPTATEIATTEVPTTKIALELPAEVTTALELAALELTALVLALELTALELTALVLLDGLEHARGGRAAERAGDLVARRRRQPEPVARLGLDRPRQGQQRRHAQTARQPRQPPLKRLEHRLSSNQEGAAQDDPPGAAVARLVVGYRGSVFHQPGTRIEDKCNPGPDLARARDFFPTLARVRQRRTATPAQPGTARFGTVAGQRVSCGKLKLGRSDSSRARCSPS